MSGAARIGAAGFALIAVCYGLARFAFGLFLPEIRSDLALSTAFAGIIAGGSFLGYCLAILVSAHLSERYGPRPVAVAAGIVACAGLAAIALSSNGAVLAGAVLFAGLSTGLASPPLAAAVAVRVEARRRDLTNTVINAGTSVGVTLSGPAALALGAEWRTAFAVFAALAGLVAIAAYVAFPTERRRVGDAPRVPTITPELAKLATAAFLMGAASTALWSFGGELAGRNLGWGSTEIGMLWVVIGVTGIFGGAAGAAISRLGLNRVHAATLGALFVSI